MFEPFRARKMLYFVMQLYCCIYTYACIYVYVMVLCTWKRVHNTDNAVFTLLLVTCFSHFVHCKAPGLALLKCMVFACLYVIYIYIYIYIYTDK
jgi:hypothetical protein